MSTEISKAYEPQTVEAKWYAFWVEKGCFTAHPESPKPAYSIVIPPPNVTGMLHMGHVLNNTIQDILARKARMDGKEVLWLPGTDHAGIATQAVVEKTLRKQGLMKHRDDLGREKFLEHVWAWKEKHGGIIIEQLRKLGCSCDWTRQRFTMDAAYSGCVQRVFFELYRQGLIYRGKRMVNWDPAARTALSDEEVEMVQEKGHLWHLKYPLLDDQGQPKPGEFVVVATTRPETMLGDEAVAVNPADPRYTQLVGRRCLLPLQNKPIPVIADEFVDPKFGTGCVKVTPAHDPNDYQMAVRHHLPFTVVIGPDGAMTREAGGGFERLDRLEARQAVVERLTALGLLLKTEDYVHNVGHSQRSGVPIEPYLSEQWFLKYPSVGPAHACVALPREATENDAAPATAAKPPGDPMRFHPDRWAKVYDHWMSRIQDWCISRQLWWGHQVPVWVLHVDSEENAARAREAAAYLKPAATATSQVAWNPVAREFIDGVPAADAPVDSAAPRRFEVCLGPDSATVAKRLEVLGFRQDPDVLDTWFSSWLWPFATMGWPERTETLRKFYPTTDLVTGPDIIFFWVARMIMAGFEFMGDLPFRNVYFTGIIRDKLGRKMSKSLGNSPDPLDLIARYGADALRFGTMRSAPLGQDVLFDEKDVELGRNFCNKLWNACRFRQMQGGEVQGEIAPARLTSNDRWILLKLDQAIREITTAFTEYRFNEATQTLYRFFWSEYCDWYIEASKAVLQGSDPAAKANTLAVLDFVLSHTLRLFHPFLPFITEELWHGMGYHQDMPADQGGQTIMFARWPKPIGEDEKAFYGLSAAVEEEVARRFDFIAQIRNLRTEKGVPANKRIRVVFVHTDRGLPEPEWAAVRLLAGIETIDFATDYQPVSGEPFIHPPFGGKLFMPLAGLTDVEAEKKRLRKELEKAEAEVTKVQQKLGNPNFTSKAPPPVLEEHRQRLLEWQGKRDRAQSALAALGA